MVATHFAHSITQLRCRSMLKNCMLQPNRWLLIATVTSLQCWCTGITSLLHQVIDIIACWCLLYIWFQCSIRVAHCDKDEQVNRDLVERYRLKYGMPGKALRCYYDGNSLAARGAVLHKNIHWTLGFHVIFWPGFLFVSGILVCAIMCYAKKHRKRRLMAETGEERF